MMNQCEEMADALRPLEGNRPGKRNRQTHLSQPLKNRVKPFPPRAVRPGPSQRPGVCSRRNEEKHSPGLGFPPSLGNKESKCQESSVNVKTMVFTITWTPGRTALVDGPHPLY